MVDAFYEAALANGGRDNGAPGERPYHPGYYAAFVLDRPGDEPASGISSTVKPCGKLKTIVSRIALARACVWRWRRS